MSHIDALQTILYYESRTSVKGELLFHNATQLKPPSNHVLLEVITILTSFMLTSAADDFLRFTIIVATFTPISIQTLCKPGRCGRAR